MKNAGRLLLAMLKFLVWSSWSHTVIAVLRELARQVMSFWAVLSGKKVLNLVLIKPSKYDDETGFVWQDFRGVYPSNTLATLYSLIQDVQQNLRLGIKVHVVVRIYDEAVEAVLPSRIAFLCRTLPGRTLVMLAGVQTSQFVRASDLALEFRKREISVIMGGYHVSGILKQFPQDGSADNTRAYNKLGLKALTDKGVALFAGEAEGRMLGLLHDFLSGSLKSTYNYVDDPPSLLVEPVPMSIAEIKHRFVYPNTSTIDACRGCPFSCQYCTIWVVQGRKIRARGVQCFADAIRANWKLGIRAYFLTSDNTARDPYWQERFDTLIAMQDEEGIRIHFLMQVDTQCHKIPGFLEKAARAGCSMAFIGLESLNPLNLSAVGKGQNHVEQYREMMSAFRMHGIATHLAYMIGLPFDTPESVQENVLQLMDLEPDTVSFFIATPLPGAMDHKQLFLASVPMDQDLNSYDSFSHPVLKHPLMSREEWLSAYQSAWETFYSTDNMVRVLRHTERRDYWKVFWNLVWYKYALMVPKRHPMVAGFARVRSRHSRRRSFPQLNLFQFWAYNTRENIHLTRETTRFLRIMLEVWLQTREQGKIEEEVVQLVEKKHAGHWPNLKLSELRNLYQSQGHKVPSGFRLASIRTSARNTRVDIEEHWQLLIQNVAHGKIWLLFSARTIRFAHADFTLFVAFLKDLLQAKKPR